MEVCCDEEIVETYKNVHFPNNEKLFENNSEREKAEKMPLPPLDYFKEALAEKTQFIFMLDKIVEHIAFWIIKNKDLKTREGHSIYRKRLEIEYPLLTEMGISVSANFTYLEFHFRTKLT